MNKCIRVFAPATVANMACGFDVMGFAINKPGDELVITTSNEPGVRITKITGDEGKLPFEPALNTAGKPILSMVKKFRIKCGVEIEINKKMPLGSGLGSSAASAVAAVFALNALFELKLSKDELLSFALEGEQLSSGTVHADNVAPCLYGGIVLIRSNKPLDIIALKVPDKLYCTIIHPQIVIPTKDSRRILPVEIPLSSAVTQWGNIAALVAGIMKSDYDLIGRSLQDVVIEPVRSQLIPGFSEMKKAALDNGALGCSISGSGPSLFALSKGIKTASRVGKAMQKCLIKYNLQSELYVSKVNKNGPEILKDR